MRAILAAVLFTTLACGQPPADDPPAAPPAAEDARVIYDIGLADLQVARLVINLDEVIARFTAPASELPLERVQILGFGQAPQSLADVVERCFEIHGHDVTGGGQFMVGQGEGTALDGCGGGCAPCGFTTVCAGVCRGAGDGRAPGATTSGDVDPEEGGALPSGGEGGSSSSNDGRGDRAGSGADSGASSGGQGGSHGGVGNPGDL